MANHGSERMVLRIPAAFTAERLAQLCRVQTDSPAFEVVEEALPLVNEYGAPGAVLRWADVERVEGDFTTVNGVTFESKVVADKLRDVPRVFLSVITAGHGLEESGLFDGDPIKNYLAAQWKQDILPVEVYLRSYDGTDTAYIAGHIRGSDMAILRGETHSSYMSQNGAKAYALAHEWLSGGV